MQAPVLVLNQNTKRETGRKAQLGNIAAAKTVADIIRTTLGPRAMLKMILDPMSGVVLTTDGNAILREIDVSHPAAKSMIELSRTQDEEVGDGTTAVIILAGQLLQEAKPFLDRNMHPRILVYSYYKALEAGLAALEAVAKPLDTNNDELMMGLVNSVLGTKLSSRFGKARIAELAYKSVKMVADVDFDGTARIDIKRNVRIENIPGGMLEDCCVVDGIVVNKNVTHQKMRRRIENPRVVLLDCPLEYKKGESQTNIEIGKDTDWDQILKIEEEYVKNMCDAIIAHKPDIVITEKGVSDLAQHFFMKAGVSCIRRVRKTDNNRLARATGATVVHEGTSMKDTDVGTGCGLFEVRKIGDEYFAYFEQCVNPKACTVLLRGASKDGLQEMNRNMRDAMTSVRNILRDPRVCPGGGATELAVAAAIRRASKSVDGASQWPFRAVAKALEIIPQTLIENCGANTMRLLTQLRAKHAKGENSTWGVDGEKGVVADMNELGIWESLTVKEQSLKTAVESACMLLRIDDIVSGMSSGGQGEDGGEQQE